MLLYIKNVIIARTAGRRGGPGGGAHGAIKVYLLVLENMYDMYTRIDSATPSVHAYILYHSIRTAVQVG